MAPENGFGVCIAMPPGGRRGSKTLCVLEAVDDLLLPLLVAEPVVVEPDWVVVAEPLVVIDPADAVVLELLVVT